MCKASLMSGNFLWMSSSEDKDTPQDIQEPSAKALYNHLAKAAANRLSTMELAKGICQSRPKSLK